MFLMMKEKSSGNGDGIMRRGILNEPPPGGRNRGTIKERRQSDKHKARTIMNRKGEPLEI